MFCGQLFVVSVIGFSISVEIVIIFVVVIMGLIFIWLKCCLYVFEMVQDIVVFSMVSWFGSGFV